MRPSRIADSESGRRHGRSLAGGRDDLLRRGHELCLQTPVAREILLLEAEEAKLVLAQAEGGVSLRAESHQLREMGIEVRVLDILPGAVDLSRHRVELLAKGADDVRVRHLESLAEQVLREARLGAQGQQAPIPRQLRVGRAFVERGGSAVEIPIPGREEQDLIVDLRHQDVSDRTALRLDLGGHDLPVPGQLDPPLHGSIDPVNVLDEVPRHLFHLLQEARLHLHLAQGLDDLSKPGALRVELRAGGGELLAGIGRDEAGGGRDQKRAPLRQQEGGVEIRNAAFGDPALRVTDVEERVAPDETRREREREGPAEAEVELSGDPEAAAPGAGARVAGLRSGPLGFPGFNGGRGHRGSGLGRLGRRGFAAHRSVRPISRSMGR